MVAEISVGDAGRNYMQGVLRQCKGAALHLVEVVSKPGRIFAPLPLETTEDRALQFGLGGLSSQSDALNWLFSNLTSKRDGTLILQDVWSQPSDLEVRRPVLESYVTDGSQVYYYLPSFSLSPDKLIDLHKQVSSFQVIGFYVAHSLNLTFEQRRHHRVPAGYFDHLAPSTMAVYVSAYDQESWVVWQPVQ